MARGGYIDDSNEFVMRKSTFRARSVSRRDRGWWERAMDMDASVTEIEARVVPGKPITLAGRQVRLLDIVPGHKDNTIKYVRYHVIGVNNASGSPRVFRTKATVFLQLLLDGQAHKSA